MKIVREAMHDRAVTQTYIDAAYAALDADQKLADVHLALSDDQASMYGYGRVAELDNPVELVAIEVPEDQRGQGLGHRCMKIVTALADQRRVTLVLTVADDDLLGFFEDCGFAGDRKMWRPPV